MSSVRKRGNKCYTRTNKAGVPYVVCNDPPKGSRGQAGVYQAKNPTGKQDGRTARNKAKNDKEIALRKVRRAMVSKKYAKELKDMGIEDAKGRDYDDPLNPYTFNLDTNQPRNTIPLSRLERPTGIPAQEMKNYLAAIMPNERLRGISKAELNVLYNKDQLEKKARSEGKPEPRFADELEPRNFRALNFPKKKKMLIDLANAKVPPEQFIKMPMRYIKIRWLRETKAGKKFRKDNEMEKPHGFVDVDNKSKQEDMAENFADALKGFKSDLPTTFTEGAIGESVGSGFAATKENYDRFEAGKMSAAGAEIFQDNLLRYKHYLELAGRRVPDWVRDATP